MKNIFKLQLYKAALFILCFSFIQVHSLTAQCEECPDVTLNFSVVNGNPVNLFSVQFNNGLANSQLEVTITHVFDGASNCTFQPVNTTINIDNTGYGETFMDNQPFGCLYSGASFTLSFNSSTCDYSSLSSEGQTTLTGCNGVSIGLPLDCPDCPTLSYNNVEGELTLTYPQIYAYSGQEMTLSCGTFIAYVGSINENSQVITELPPNSQECFNESSIFISMSGGKTCTYESLNLIDCEIPEPICEECPQINIYRPASIPYVAFQFNENTSSPQEISILCNGTQFATYSLILDGGFGILDISSFDCNGSGQEFSFTVGEEFTCSYDRDFFGVDQNGTLETLVECSPPIISNTCETCPWIINSGGGGNLSYYFIRLATTNSTVPQSEDIFVICNGEILTPFQFSITDTEISFRILNDFTTTCFEDQDFTVVFDNGQVCSYDNNSSAYSCHLVEDTQECEECPDVEYNPKYEKLNIHFSSNAPPVTPVVLSCENEIIGTFDPVVESANHWSIGMQLNDCIAALGLTASIGSSECSYIGSLIEECGTPPPVDEGCNIIGICEDDLTQFILNYPGSGCKKWDYNCNIEDRIYRYGKVAIGNPPNVPNGYNLALENGLITDQAKVELCETGGWCDYVFNEDYNLLSLQDIECYIEENGYLPNTTTEQEVRDKNGIEVRSVMLNHQEKIEEIFIHLIEMNESLTKVKDEIRLLEIENQYLRNRKK